jgi:peptide/nickel transport system ATP-binding protein
MTVTTVTTESSETVALQQPNGNYELPLLSIQDLHVWFELRKWGFLHAGNVRAVDGVSFDLYRGQAVAVVGESGCGKSSLMKTILGLNRPTNGDLVFDNMRLSEVHGAQMRVYLTDIGYVQQDPYGALAPFMTVEAILSEPMIVNGIRNKKERARRIQQALTEVKMTPVEEFLHKYPHMLSGGQQQRIVIARAMIMEPKLLVADEPVSMLDASVRVEILKLLRSLQQQRDLAVIYITHDLSTVRYFSERIFVMYAGQLIEKGEVNELIANPKHPYTVALLNATAEPDAKNAEVYRDIPPGEPPSLVNPPKGCRFHPRCPHIIKGVCDEKMSPEFEPEPGHLVSCWLYDDEFSSRPRP